MALGITDAVLEEIKARVDIADLIASYGISVKTAGSGKVACCPFHHEKTPSFHINSARGFYHCFGCGESGDIIKFVQKMDALTFVEAVKKLAESCSVNIEETRDADAERRRRLYQLMAELARFYRRCLAETREGQLARDYLSSRDLGTEVQDDFLIGYAPKGMAPIVKWAEKHGFTLSELAAAGVIKPPESETDEGYHRFGGRLMFSIRDRQGRVVAFSGRQLVENRNSGKYVNSPETLIFKKSSILFGFDKAAGNIAKSPHQEAIVCEGQIDTIRLHISGFPVAVASQGTAFTEEHVKLLKRVAEQVTLVFDDDAAGHKATVRTARLFLEQGMPVKVVKLPAGDDPDSFLRKHPKAEFQQLVDDAESIIRFQTRIERAKERDPGSIDALARITRALLATVAASGSAVIRASMIAEAANCLSLPQAALAEELESLSARVSRKKVFAASPSRSGDYPGIMPAESREPELEFREAAKAEPPSEFEFAFCSFLMENERDAVLHGMVGEFLPQAVFGHPFTWKFVETWKAEAGAEEDLFVKLRASLAADEIAWLDRIFADGAAGRTRQCAESEAHILEDFIRRFWSMRLKRLQGDLPAAGDAAAEAKRFEISYNIRRFRDDRWNKVKAMIREMMKGDN